MAEFLIRKAREEDIDAVEALYEKIHDAEENGTLTIGWIRGIYPVRQTAEDARKRGDLYVLTEAEKVLGAAVINHIQVDIYRDAKWKQDAEDKDVCVLHTLVIDPDASGKGYGKAFVRYYETYAKENGCPELRMDTNEKNKTARAMYQKLGYEEIGILPTEFNGIPNVNLVLLEKSLQ